MTRANRRAILDEATLQLALSGIRGTTLRKIGAQSGTNFTRLASSYGGKDKLIAACFADVVDRDLHRLTALADELGSNSLISLLWAICEDAGGSRRTDNLVLTELLLASGRPDLDEIFRYWIRERRDRLRAIAGRNGIDLLVVDILGLFVLMECGFAVSNYDSLNYRLIARAGLEEAVHRLLGTSQRHHDDQFEALVADYYVAPRDRTAPDGDGETEGGKSQIVNAAAEIFLEQGPEHLTNRAVAQRAGVSLALTTYHFRSITELTLAAGRRAVESFLDSLELDTTVRDKQGRTLPHVWRSRLGDSEQINHGLLRVSLTAARVPSEAHLGNLVRRQMGLAAYAAVDSGKRGSEVSRTAAATYSLWAGACYLVSRSFSPDVQPYDFDAQAALAGRCLLGF